MKSLKLTFLSLILATLPLYAQLSRDVDALLANQEPVFVHLNGFGVDFEVDPVIVNGRTFVEVNALFSRLGIALSWYGPERRVTGTAPNGNVIRLYIGRTDAYINGVRHTLDAAPFIATPYNRTMIPLSFVAAATGASVGWVNDPRTADIWNNDNRFCSIISPHQLAEFTWRGYLPFNEDGPIGVVRGTLQNDGIQRTAYLVALSGTDLAAAGSGSATGILEDLIVGGWNGENAFLREARNVIGSRIPRGASLILTGHSLGGMVAQQLASDSFVKDNYNVLNTITLGSPLISPGTREGDVKRLGDIVDPVPYLSSSGVTVPWWNIFGLQRENAGISNPIKSHNLSYRLKRVWGAYDALGYKYGDAIFTFYSKDVRRYAAPRL